MVEPSIVMLSTVTLAADALPEAVIFPILVKFLEESITVVFDEPIFIVFTNKLSHILLVNPKEDIAVVSGLKAPPLSLPASHLTPLAVLEEFKALISICPLASCWFLTYEVANVKFKAPEVVIAPLEIVPIFVRFLEESITVVLLTFILFSDFIYKIESIGLVFRYNNVFRQTCTRPYLKDNS